MQTKAISALENDHQMAPPVHSNRKQLAVLKQRMKAPTAQPVEFGGKIDSGENKEKAVMGLKQLQSLPEVCLQVLHVITSSSFQPA